jgi:ABC-type glycerol-3-phosphate transport system substrate-binding protein
MMRRASHLFGRMVPLLLSLTVACSLPPQPPATAVPTSTALALAPTRVPTATPQPTATAVPLPQLTLWVGENAAEFTLLQPLLSAAADTAGLDLTLARRDADGLRASLAVAEQLGEAPPDLLWADQHVLAALQAAGDLAAWPAEFNRGVIPALRDWNPDDRGVPLTAQNLLLLYRLPDQPLPASAAELSELAQAAILPARAGLVQGWGALAWFYPWYRALGGTLVDGADQPTLNNEALTTTIDVLRGMYRAAPRNGDTLDRGRRLLANGQTAYSIDSDAAWSTLTTLSETLQVEISALPPISDGSRAPTLIGGSWLLARNGLDADQTAAAERFAAVLQSDATQRQLSSSLQRLPVRPALHGEASVQSDARLRAMAAAAAVSEGLAPTDGVRCATFALEVYLYNAITADRLPATIAATIQSEAEYCLRLKAAERTP